MRSREAHISILPERQMALDVFTLSYLRKEIQDQGGLILQENITTFSRAAGNLLVETQGLQITVRGDELFHQWLQTFQLRLPWDVEVVRRGK